MLGREGIAKPEIFRVRPLGEYGTFIAIAELLLGLRNLRKTMDGLQVRLYAAAWYMQKHRTSCTVRVVWQAKHCFPCIIRNIISTLPGKRGTRETER